MNQSQDDLSADVSNQVRRIVTEGENVRQRVSELVAQQAEGFQKTGEGFVKLTRSVLDGTLKAIEESLPDEPQSVLKQVTDALGDGFSHAALATRLAFEEAQKRNEQFATEDLKQVSQDLVSLQEAFVKTVVDSAQRLQHQAMLQTGQLTEHANQVYGRIMPSLRSALEATAQNPTQFGKEAAEASVKFSKQAAGNLFSAMSKLMQQAADRLKQ
jgi:hypothetical protein